MDPPAEVYARDPRDRRRYVDDADVAVVDLSLALARQLHEQRRQGDVAGIAGVDGAAIARVAEALAVIGRHDDQRPVIETFRTQPLEQLTDQAIR